MKQGYPMQFLHQPLCRFSTMLSHARLFDKLWIWGLFVTFFSSLSYGQITDNQCNNVPGISVGSAKVTPVIGCVPLRVKASNAQMTSRNTRFIFDYKGGNPTSYIPSTDSTFTFTKAGTYIIMQLSEGSDGRPERACVTITAQDTLTPYFQVAHCDEGKVRLSLPKHPNNMYDEYLVEWGDGNVALLNRLTSSYNYQYKDLNPKTVTVVGRHKTSGCGGKGTRKISFDEKTVPATISKLEILDPITAELTIENPNSVPLELFRQDGGGVFQTTGKIINNATEKVKVLADTNRIYCYKLKPLDVCLSGQESNKLCTVFVRVIPEDDKNMVVITPYFYLNDVKQLNVSRNDKFWWTPNRTDLFRPDMDAPCGRKSCYRLTLETQYGTVLSNKYCSDPPLALCTAISNLFVAEVFTPNGDGINDVWEVKSENAQSPQITIFDRWGKIVFQTNVNTPQWNGTIEGQPAPVGPYFYRILVVDKIGRQFIKRGTVSLVR